MMLQMILENMGSVAKGITWTERMILVFRMVQESHQAGDDLEKAASAAMIKATLKAAVVRLSHRYVPDPDNQDHCYLCGKELRYTGVKIGTDNSPFSPHLFTTERQVTVTLKSRAPKP